MEAVRGDPDLASPTSTLGRDIVGVLWPIRRRDGEEHEKCSQIDFGPLFTWPADQPRHAARDITNPVAELLVPTIRTSHRSRITSRSTLDPVRYATDRSIVWRSVPCVAYGYLRAQHFAFFTGLRYLRARCFTPHRKRITPHSTLDALC